MKLCACLLRPAAAFALAGVLSAPDALACRTTTCAVQNPAPDCSVDGVTQCLVGGHPLFWEQQCVAFSVDNRAVPSMGLDFPAVEQLVGASFALWPNADCSGAFPSIAVSSLGPLACHVPEYNRTGPNANGVIFYDADWPHDPQELGVTTVTFDTDTGKLLDADMDLNLTGLQRPIELEYVVAHEAGHFFGLDHSVDDTALMFSHYVAVSATTSPTLAADDVAGICAAYPPSRAVGVCDFEPERGYASDCGGDVTGGCQLSPRSNRSGGLTATIPLLVAAIFLRRRKKPAMHAHSLMLRPT
jgi:hypothetical protein